MGPPKVILAWLVLVESLELILGKLFGSFYGKLGLERNNVSKLNGLLQGIKITYTHSLFLLVAEGGSALILNLAISSRMGRVAPISLPAGDWTMIFNN